MEGAVEAGKDFKTLMAEYERELILAALQATGGHQRRAAARLGILPTTLFEKMKRLGLRTRCDD
jgi:DNA-binding NtrC family response regulator